MSQQHMYDACSSIFLSNAWAAALLHVKKSAPKILLGQLLCFNWTPVGNNTKVMLLGQTGSVVHCCLG